MTVETPHGTPQPKAAPPGLSARAPRPPVIRLRRSIVLSGALAVAFVVAVALAWAFVVQPRLRVDARSRAAAQRPQEAQGSARPAEVITGQPATYDRLAAQTVPPPRGLAAPAVAADETQPHKGHSAAPRTTVRRSPGDARPGPAADARKSGLFFTSARPATASTETHAEPGPATASAALTAPGLPGHGLTAPASPYEVQAGAVLPAILLTAVDTSRPGPVVASLTENVFDTVTGRQLLLPQGARLIGRHDGASQHGDRRAFVTWDRLILPNGKSLTLASEPGVDAQGAIGLPGRVDRRLGPLAVASLFAGAITTLGQAARDDHSSGGWLGDAGDAAAIEAAQVGGRMIDRELDVKPSIRLDAGARVRVLLTHDLVLEPYEP